jgi:hypothetical protein
MLKRFLFTLIALFTFLGAQAQAGFPKPTFKASYSKTSASAGDVIEIIVRFDVAKGFHVYSEKSDCGEGQTGQYCVVTPKNVSLQPHV